MRIETLARGYERVGRGWEFWGKREVQGAEVDGGKKGQRERKRRAE